jgi:hypothetical protein
VSFVKISNSIDEEIVSTSRTLDGGSQRESCCSRKVESRYGQVQRKRRVEPKWRI